MPSTVYQTSQNAKPAEPSPAAAAYTALLERFRRALGVDAENVDIVLAACNRTTADLVADLLRNGQRSPQPGDECSRCGKALATRTSKLIGETVVAWLICDCPKTTKTHIPKALTRRRNS